MIGDWTSILPPLVAIIMVLVTKRVLLSLGTGIVLAALLIGSFSPVESVIVLWNGLIASFWDGESWNTGNIFIMLFILMLGVITAFVSLSGGSRAFADWASRRIKTKRGAKILTVFLGILIFVDDYFNSLAVGQIARPVSDEQKVSRAQLAYFIDSTSAPICVVSPISSWGAYLIGQLAIIFGATAAITYSPLSAFVLMAPMNFYVVATLTLVFFFAFSDTAIFSMRRHEELAEETGQLFDPEKEIPGQLKEDFPEHHYGRVRDLVLPIVTLIIVTFGMMFVTGIRASGSYDIWAIFEETNVPASLVTGGIAGVLVAVLLYLPQLKTNDQATVTWMRKATVSGLQSMMPAVLILFLAWALTDLIATLKTGEYLASVVEQSNISPLFLPVMMFVLGGVIAFSTGTSWGSFGILLPIAAEIMIATDINLLLPALAAVLAGAVFGDHCSPISDTTILSATGAGCNHIDHVSTQLPYALLAAAIALIGYVTLGLTGSVWVGLGAVVVSLIVTMLVILQLTKRRSARTVS